MTPSEQSYPEVSYARLPSKGMNHYFISSDGRVFRVSEIKPQDGGKGYKVVALFNELGVRIYRSVHSVVAEAFIGPRPDGLVIDHVNGDKSDNSAGNLEYVTSAENTIRAWKTGLCSKRPKEFYGRISRLGAKKLKDTRMLSTDEAIEIIAEYRRGNHTMKEIAATYGVSKETIWHVIHGKTCYKDVPR